MVLDTNTPLNEFLNVSLKLDASSASQLLRRASPTVDTGVFRQATDHLSLVILCEGRRRFHRSGDRWD